MIKQTLSVLLLVNVGASPLLAQGMLDTLSNFFTAPIYTLYTKHATLQTLQDETNEIGAQFSDLIGDYNGSSEKTISEVVLSFNKAVRKRAKLAAKPFSTAFEEQEKRELNDLIARTKAQPFIFFDKELHNAIGNLAIIADECTARVTEEQADQYQTLLDNANELKVILKSFHKKLVATEEYQSELTTGRAQMIIVGAGILAVAWYMYANACNAAPEAVTPEALISEPQAIDFIAENAAPVLEAAPEIDAHTIASLSDMTSHMQDTITSHIVRIWNNIQTIDTQKMAEDALEGIRSVNLNS